MIHTVTIGGSTVEWEYRKKVGEAWVPEATDEHLSSYEKGIIKEALDKNDTEGYIQYISGGRTKWRKMIWKTKDTSTGVSIKMDRKKDIENGYMGGTVRIFMIVV